MLPGRSGAPITVGVLEEERLLQKTRFGAIVGPLYDERFLDYLADYAWNQIADLWDLIIMYTGERRVGKSTFALKLARRIDPDFPVRHVAFRLDGFDNLLGALPRADAEHGLFPQAALDEAGYDLFAQNWMQEVQRNTVRKFEVIGEKGEIVHMMLPHRCHLNKGLRDSMAKLWVNVETDQGKRGLAVICEAVPNKWELEVYWRPLGAMRFSPFEDDDPFWTEYMTTKRAFVDEAASARSEPDMMNPRRAKATAQRDAALRALRRFGGLKNREIAEQVGLPKGTVDRVLSQSPP